MALTARDLMKSPVVTIRPESTVIEAAKLMDKKDIGSLLVEDDTGIVGIITEKDLLKRVIARGISPDSTLVHEIMTRPIRTVDVDAGVDEITEILEKYNIRRIPVTENNKIVGIITAGTLMNKLRYSYAKRRRDISMGEYYRPEYKK